MELYNPGERIHALRGAQSEFSLVSLSFVRFASCSAFVIRAGELSYLVFGRYCVIISRPKDPCNPERDWFHSGPLSFLADRFYPNKSAEVHRAR